MKRLVWSVVLIVALLAVLDRVAFYSAQHDVAQRLQADARLHEAPAVHIHGYPFLTQLVGGEFDDIDVVMHGLDSNGVRIDRLTVHVQGAHVSIGDVISQDRSRIRIDHATAKLLLRSGDLRQSAVDSVSVRGGDTVVLHTAAGDVPVRLAGLPFGIRLTSAQTTQDGIEVTGDARGLVLHT